MPEQIMERTCRACRTKRRKKDLIRIVRIKDSLLEMDPRQVLPGRGWYLCPKPACLSILSHPKALRKAFGCRADIGSELEKFIKVPPLGGLHG